MAKISAELLINRISETRNRLTKAVAALPDEQLRRKNLIQGYSLADYLLFLSHWEREFAFGLREIQRHKRPTQTLRVWEAPQKMWEVCVAQSAEWTIAELLDELELAHYQLIERLTPLTLDDLNEAGQHRWLGNKPLWPLLAQHSYEMEQRHLPLIEQMARHASPN